MGKEEQISERMTKVLLGVYSDQWNHLLHLHDIEWKCAVVIGVVVVGLMGLAHFVPKLAVPFIIVAFANVFAGVRVITRFRVDFLSKIMVLARIEKLLGLYREYPQFKDGRLLPSGWDISNRSFDEWVRKQKYAWHTRYFAFVVFFALLTLGLVITSILLILT